MKRKKEEHPASCGVPFTAAGLFIGGGGSVSGLPDCRLHLPGVGLDKDLQYVVGGHCRWVGVVEPIVQLAFPHSGIAISSLLTCSCPSYDSGIGIIPMIPRSF